jgi:hypothetical protein
MAARRSLAAAAAPIPFHNGGTTMAKSLFKADTFASKLDNATLERVPLDRIDLAPNARKRIDPAGIDHLAGLLMRSGQLVPAIGWRNPKTDTVVLYAGQRRLLAARRTHELAGQDDYADAKPVDALRVLLFAGGRPPTQAEVKRLQSMENAGREDLCLADQQDQFLDCWRERASLPEDERMRMVAEDMGVSVRAARNLAKQVTLPEEIRTRVAAKRTEPDHLSIALANTLADINSVAPQLASAVAARITSTELHDAAVSDIGSFVHKTTLDSDDLYAVRLTDGSLLVAAQELARARRHLDADQLKQVATLLKCEKDKDVNKALDALAKRATDAATQIRVDAMLRDRVTNGKYGYRYQRGETFADSVWVTDPVFMVGLIDETVGPEQENAAPAREEGAYFGAGGRDQEARQEADAEDARRKEAAARRAEAAARNLGLGMDINAKLIDPDAAQLDALRRIVCLLVADRYPEVIAYGAGWTDSHRQQPVGDTGRMEPRAISAIVEAELDRALQERDPFMGVAHLVARFAAAFMLDTDGIPRTKALGTERMERKLRDAVAGGDSPLRSALWQFMRPMLSPSLAERHHDAFVPAEDTDSTVDLDAYRADADLADLDLGDDLTRAA